MRHIRKTQIPVRYNFCEKSCVSFSLRNLLPNSSLSSDWTMTGSLPIAPYTEYTQMDIAVLWFVDSITGGSGFFGLNLSRSPLQAGSSNYGLHVQLARHSDHFNQLTEENWHLSMFLTTRESHLKPVLLFKLQTSRAWHRSSADLLFLPWRARTLSFTSHRNTREP